MTIDETATGVVLRVVSWDHPDAEELRAAQRADIVTRARERGATRVRLETGDRQPEAVRLYEGAGYRQIPNFGAYVDAQASLCFERVLAATE